ESVPQATEGAAFLTDWFVIVRTAQNFGELSFVAVLVTCGRLCALHFLLSFVEGTQPLLNPRQCVRALRPVAVRLFVVLKRFVQPGVVDYDALGIELDGFFGRQLFTNAGDAGDDEMLSQRW